MLARAVADEFSIVLVAPSITLAAQRHSTARLGGQRLEVATAAPSTNATAGAPVATSVTMPAASALLVGVEHAVEEVTTQLSTFARDLHVGEGGGGSVLLSATTTLTLRDGRGTELPLRLAASNPVELRMPFTLRPSPVGTGCTDASYLGLQCSGRGVCVSESDSCACDSGWGGRTCNESATCTYWDESGEEWSEFGCVAVRREAGADGTLVLTCHCNHTSDFGSVLAGFFPSGNFSINLPNLGDLSQVTWQVRVLLRSRQS